MWIAKNTIAAGRNARTSSTPFNGPPFACRKSPSPISCAIPIASTATSTATGGAASHASTAVSPVPITAWSSHPPHGDGVVLFSFIVPPPPGASAPAQHAIGIGGPQLERPAAGQIRHLHEHAGPTGAQPHRHRDVIGLRGVALLPLGHALPVPPQDMPVIRAQEERGWPRPR